MINNLLGRRFTRWLVLAREGTLNHFVAWRCKCDCGTERVLRSSHLTRGVSRSCGCLKRELTSARVKAEPPSRKHGQSRTNVYIVWSSMHARCNRKTSKAYYRYGGRGIVVCEEWYSFENFLADMGRPEKGFTLERKDNDGPYCLANCKWATPKEQAQNRRSTRKFEFNGEQKTVLDWSKQVGINAGTILSRLHQLGWSIDRALTTPVHKGSQP